MDILKKTEHFMQVLGIEERPMGIVFTDKKPEECFSPKEGELPTREKEMKNEIDWGSVFENFSCVIGHIWRARRKDSAACFSSSRYGCPGAAFWLGFMKPQTQTIIHYISSGIPEQMEGEFYCESPQTLARIFEEMDPEPAGGKYCVVKPLSQFTENEIPELVCFFSRPEPICGLHQLAFFVTNDTDVVASPWGPACGNLIMWPIKYLRRRQTRAVLGGWDPSARKFFKPDELSFTVPFHLYREMLEKYDSSFLKTNTWKTVQKKIELSKKTWS